MKKIWGIFVTLSISLSLLIAITIYKVVDVLEAYQVMN